MYKVLLIASFFLMCKNANKNDIEPLKNESTITCTMERCQGYYVGVEFENGSDIAHQFSNKMSKSVGDKLKELYNTNNYSKVDFSKITMSTEGMGTGNVIYKLTIPFLSVKNKCDAFTSFDHVGGWNHKPSLKSRKIELKKALLPGEKLDISNLKSTKEGLQEYWIQWKNKRTQANCATTSK